MKANTFKSTKSLGLVVLILLLVRFLLLATAPLISNAVAKFIVTTGVLGYEELQAFNTGTSFLSMALIIAFLICLICWFSCVYNNYLATRVDDNNVTSATMAVVYWFIPLVNLVMPYILLKKAMDNTNSILVSVGIIRNRATSTILLVVWWCMFFFEFYVYPIVSLLMHMNLDYQSMQMQKIEMFFTAIWLIGIVLLLVFGILTFFLVRFFRQAEKQIGVPPPINDGLINY